MLGNDLYIKYMGYSNEAQQAPYDVAAGQLAYIMTPHWAAGPQLCIATVAKINHHACGALAVCKTKG